MLEAGHLILSDVLVERIDHGIDGPIGATMTVSGAIRSFRPVRRHDSLIFTVDEGGGECEVLLRLVRVDLASIEIRVHRHDLRLNYLLDLMGYFLKAILLVRHLVSQVSDFIPVVWSNDEERVDDCVMISEPIDELGPVILLLLELCGCFERLAQARCVLTDWRRKGMRANGLSGDGALQIAAIDLLRA